MSANECEKYEVYLTKRCERGYLKERKRMNPILLGEIESELVHLRTDPRRGNELAHNLAGYRSIHIDKFSYRIVYRVDNSSCTVMIEAICHRKSVYKSLKRLHE